jgi:AraC-like DNA-binding protein
MDLPPLAYAEFAPGAAVQDLVVNYWCFTVRALPWPAFRHLVWPDGCVNVSVALADGHPVATPLLGPRREPLPVDVTPGLQYWGIRFRPEMGPAALDRPASSLRDQVGPAHHWFGVEPVARLERAVRDALAPFGSLPTRDAVQDAVALALDRWLFDAADTTHPPDAAIRDAVRVIVATEGRLPIADVADVVGLSMRHLQRGFKDAVGLSPKEYALIRRGRHAIRQMLAQGGAAGAMARVAVESGYADQAHLARDFSRLMHGTSAQLRQRLFAIEHSELLG